MKFYAHFEPKWESLDIIKEENGKFFSIGHYSDGSYSWKEIPYLPKGSVVLSDVQNEKSFLKLQRINKVKQHKKIRELLAKKNLTGFKLITELTQYNSLLFTVIHDSFTSRHQSTREMIDYIMDELEDSVEFKDLHDDLSIHCVTPEDWNSRSY